jgi:hypothetical protein
VSAPRVWGVEWFDDQCSPEVADRLREQRREDARFDELAGEVIAAIEGVPAVALEMLATALNAAGGPFGRLAWGLHYCATSRAAEERGEGFGYGLARIKLAYDLRCLMFNPAATAELVDRLEGVEAPPWPQIRAGAEAAIAQRKKEGW